MKLACGNLSFKSAQSTQPHLRSKRPSYWSGYWLESSDLEILCILGLVDSLCVVEICGWGILPGSIVIRLWVRWRRVILSKVQTLLVGMFKSAQSEMKYVP